MDRSIAVIRINHDAKYTGSPTPVAGRFDGAIELVRAGTDTGCGDVRKTLSPLGHFYLPLVFIPASSFFSPIWRPPTAATGYGSDRQRGHRDHEAVHPV